MKISKKRADLRDEYDNPLTTKYRKTQISKTLHLTHEEQLLTKYRGAYATFVGSPASHGLLQFDLWNEKPLGKWDWTALKEDIVKYGIRNSLLIAPMPTASTSQILGFNESFEPFTSNIYQRQTLAGEFVIINKHLIQDLIEIGLWSNDMKNRIFTAGGSIQAIEEIPEDIRALYKTAWEMKQKVLIDQSADRGIYVCQSQSLNLFVEDPEFSKLSNMHFYGWKKGLKTGVYYLRTRPRAKITAFTIEPPRLSTIQIEPMSTSNVIPPQIVQKSPPKPTEEQIVACRLDNPESCLMCGS
jgi:ribonucleoside-diphosphate reductase alpha chain